ncbi:hypothetical protein BOTBODRAFT_38089 [Botryobasidium botryosum FD-172 SS1]|uniref:Uncharacterized protein n=1 Tax=Botryobasidium botryosum (strain FD-172 SS1) TaxID=930990 RepID=A0A067LXZ1_BOTB1|nr:hypothetical protein BOTBODRAFT_38089 [Botryobasidium botryosum FD-172 SS1]
MLITPFSLLFSLSLFRLACAQIPIGLGDGGTPETPLAAPGNNILGNPVPVPLTITTPVPVTTASAPLQPVLPLPLTKPTTPTPTVAAVTTTTKITQPIVLQPAPAATTAVASTTNLLVPVVVAPTPKITVAATPTHAVYAPDPSAPALMPTPSTVASGTIYAYSDWTAKYATATLVNAGTRNGTAVRVNNSAGGQRHAGMGALVVAGGGLALLLVQ